jgi:hypothetical protein
MAELKINQVVRIRKGKNGVVMGFNGKASLIVFDSYCAKLRDYTEDLKHKKHSEYDIVAVYDGKKVENYTDVYRKKFDLSELKEVYSEEAELAAAAEVAAEAQETAVAQA